MFAITLKNTPLFNQKEISEVFLNYDQSHLVRELEMILLPGSALAVVSDGDILEVKTEEYVPGTSFYVDRRFVEIRKEPFQERKRDMPSVKEMIRRLESFPKLPYIWGGNTQEGISELLEYYPPKKELSPFDLLYWQFKGVDCSGLLYAITNGCTPRNTSQIFNAYPEISSLKPLDLIVWKGHVLITLPHEKVIESRQYDGIVISNLSERLKQIEKHQPKFLRFL